MERLSMNSDEQLNKCEINFNSEDTFNYWPNHKEKLCNSCSITFHHNWNFKVVSCEAFTENSFKILNYIIEDLKKDGNDFNLSSNYLGFSESIEDLNSKKTKFQEENPTDKINIINRNKYIENWK